MRTSALAITAALVGLGGMAYCHLADVGMKLDEHVYYMAALFCANIAASLVLMPLVAYSTRLRSRPAALVWAAAGVLAALTIAGFVWSRTVGFPQLDDHVGDWDTLGLTSVAFEVVVVAASAWVLGGPRVVPVPRTATTLLLVAAVVAVAVQAGAGRPALADDDMPMVGNMAPYPDVDHARQRDMRHARRVLRASRRSAHAFDTIKEAKRHGYRIRDRFKPGFTHLRKHGTQFWGRILDARAPQALVFWCPSHGRCRLTTYMYRAPAGKPPSTWHRLLQWHRHSHDMTADWATHVWLLGHVREAFATCAPWPALTAELGLVEEPYRAAEHTRPCAEHAPMPAH